MKSMFVFMTILFSSQSFANNCIDDYYLLLTARIITENYYTNSEPDPIDCVDTLNHIKKNQKRDKELVELELKNYRTLKTKFDYFQVDMTYQEICKVEMTFVATPELNPLIPKFKEVVSFEKPEETCAQILKNVTVFKKEYYGNLK